jgi:hypothetical protein
MFQITDNPELEFKDISSEMYREYIYPDGSKVMIENPVAVAVKPTHRPFGGGGHRIVDKEGKGHYIPPGWIHLYWDNKPGLPRIQF